MLSITEKAYLYQINVRLDMCLHFLLRHRKLYMTIFETDFKLNMKILDAPNCLLCYSQNISFLIVICTKGNFLSSIFLLPIYRLLLYFLCYTFVFHYLVPIYKIYSINLFIICTLIVCFPSTKIAPTTKCVKKQIQ